MLGNTATEMSEMLQANTIGSEYKTLHNYKKKIHHYN